MREPAADVVHRSGFRARDPQAATRLIEGIYGPHDLQIGQPAEAFEMRGVTGAVGALSASLIRLSFANDLRAAPVAAFTTISIHEGRAVYTVDGRPTHPVGPGGVFRPSATRHLRGTSDPDAVAATVSFPLTAIADAAGAADGAEVQFLSHVPADASLGRYWIAVVDLARRQLLEPDSPLGNAIARQHLIGTLARAALVTFPNTTHTTPHLPGPGHVGPATVRRALAHMHLYADRPITLTDLATAAGVSPRALQHAFARHLGHSPVQHLRRIRLDRAHQELVAADPAAGDTVSAIARRWGFTNPSRFAATHRVTYGRLPADVLRS